MQTYYFLRNGLLARSTLPPADHEVMQGVQFGLAHVPFTPAYWLAQAHEHDIIEPKPYARLPRRLADLASTAAYCLLGGHGITAEMSTAAHAACGEARLISDRCGRTEKWMQILERPLRVRGKTMRYRFPKQKAIYLAHLMRRLCISSPPTESGVALRNWLLDSPGIGYKTAGWIVRNYLNQSDVAIIDIHLFRAMVLCGVFSANLSVNRNYLFLEERFLNFCHALGVRASDFDLLIWTQMRNFGRVAVRQFHAAAARAPIRLAVPA